MLHLIYKKSQVNFITKSPVLKSKFYLSENWLYRKRQIESWLYPLITFYAGKYQAVPPFREWGWIYCPAPEIAWEIAVKPILNFDLVSLLAAT